MRLTTHDPGYQPYVISANEPTWRAIYDKLAAYEDTGLTPEEFHESVAFVLELNKKLKPYIDAYEQGRLVILPCKVGDTVWTLNHHYRPVDGKVQSIHQNYVGDRAGRWVLTSFFPEYYGQAESGLDPDFIQTTKYFGIDDFGKTVFLSREEAEAALKGETEDV